MTLASNWTAKTLRDLATINYGRDPSTILDDDGEYPVYGTSGSERHGSAYLYDGESIILGRKGTIGRVHFADKRFWTIDTAYYLNDFKGTVPKWLYYFLCNVDLRSLNEATGVPSLSRDLLYKISVPTPPSGEQAKIAEVLSAVDQAIEQTEALIAKQQRIKTGLMQDLLTRGIDEHGNLRSELSHEFRDSPVGRIPVAWTMSSVGAEFEIQLGKMLSQESRLSRSPLPYLGNKNVQWDHVDLTNLERMDFDKGEREKFRLKPDDILVCEGGEVGRTCLWREEIEECFYQKAIHRLRPKRDYLPSLFPTYMKWAVRNGLLSDFTSQSSIAHLTKGKLKGVPIQVPPISEQVRISETIEALDRQIANHVQQLAKLISLKDGLMQDLLTGKRRVTVLLEQGSWGSE